MFFNKKWFHIFSFFLVVSPLLIGVIMVVQDLSVLLEFSMGKGEGGPFISGVFLWDSISNVFVIMVGSVSLLVLKYAYWYMGGEKKWNAFFYTFFVFVFFMFLLSISSSLFWVMLGWDGLGITSFCLVMFFSSWKSLNSALITFLTNRLGDFMFILSIWAYVCFFSENSLMFSFLGIFISLTGMTKSAQVPFSAWLPAAMAAPTPVSSLVHSSTLVTAGVFLFSRFYCFLSFYSLLLIYLGSILTILLSGMSALGEMDFKKIIALSTLSHLGFMMFFLSKGQISATMVHLLTHAFFKSLLFMCAGVIIHSNYSNQDIRKLFNINMPLMLVLSVAIMANMGIPFLSGFYSKETLVLAFFCGNLNLLLLDDIILMVSILLTCLYSIRILFWIMLAENISHSMEVSSMTDFPLLNGMLFSTLFSCSMGGILVWVISDPCHELESSFFLKKVKTMVLLILCSSFFMSKWMNLILPTAKNAKMWYIYDFSKFFSSYSFPVSKIFLHTVDIKGFLAKTPNLYRMSFQKEVFLLKPKKVFFISLFMVSLFMTQVFLLTLF